MRRLGTVLSLFATFFLIAPTWAQAPCQYAHVLDRCGKRVVILTTGETDGAHVVALDQGAAAAHEPRGVALATVPGWEEFGAFVTQGPYLHVINYLFYHVDDDGTEPPLQPWRTLSLVDHLGWGPVELGGLAAGGAITINGETVYPLYVVGYVPGVPPTPYVMIFDQRALFDGDFTVMGVLRGAGCLDHLDNSGGVAVDVSVGTTLDGGHRQVAYASVLRGSGLLVQQFHTITLEDGAGFDMHLEPWNEEGVIYAGSEPEAIGLDHESLGLGAYGVYQTSATVSDLNDGTLSCEMGPGDLTDIAVWGPDAELDHAYVQFVTASNGSEAGTLLGYPEDVCPYSVPPLATPGAMVQPVGSRPLALALSSETSSPLWVYTANGSGDVTAVNLKIYRDAVDGDTVKYLRQIDLDLGGCPSAIVFRDEGFRECMREDYGDPPGPRPDDYCDENPYDQWCLAQLKEKPGLQ